MASLLRLYAGKSAYQHIQQQGLSAEDVYAVLGASGAAKWFTIFGLDRYLFERFLPQSDRQVTLYGTSIGAWKLSAATMPNPGDAFEKMAARYIAQTYDTSSTIQDVLDHANGILDSFLSAENIAHSLQHEKYRLHLGTVRCHGLLGCENRHLQMLGMAWAGIKNAIRPTLLKNQFERVLFSDSRAPISLGNLSDYDSSWHGLNEKNYRHAMLASGAIPYVVPGIRDIPGANKGVYRDGGVIDYHPLGHFLPREPGIVLYPHFYPYVVPGWFDKSFRSRRANALQMDNVLLVAPSDEFVKTLPYQRIPDRKDFNRLDTQARQKAWRDALTRSHELGHALDELIASGNIAAEVKLFPTP